VLHGEDTETVLEVLGDGETDLIAGANETSPSHSTPSVTALPGPEGNVIVLVEPHNRALIRGL
jgi:hypothetical protein